MEKGTLGCGTARGFDVREYGAMSDVAADAPREPYPFKGKDQDAAGRIPSV